MKKIFLIVFIAVGINTRAQITLEHTYDTASTLYSIFNLYRDQLMIINFSVSGEEYVKINRQGEAIEFYDMNHSYIKSISYAGFPQDLNNFPSFLYISQNLFSNDSKIEFMYVYEYNATNGYGIYATNIYNEDGVILFSDTGGAAIVANYEQQQLPIYSTSVGTKMILSYRFGQAKVYSLPGTLTVDIEEANKKLITMQSSVSNAYPNPNNGSTKIDYTLPPGVNEGEIVFYNLQGMEIKRFKVNRTFNTLLISTKDIAAGTYYYQLQTSAQSSEGKKMVVIK
jgi:hypothetical protein